MSVAAFFAVSTICSLTALSPLAAAAQSAKTEQTGAPGKAFAHGDVVDIAPNTRLIIGRAFDMQAGEVDIANVGLHKTGTTLVVIDSGGTSGFTAFLDKAAAQLQPYDNVVLVTTHGHADHVGNNAWIDTLGVPTTHFISAHDLATMRDQIGYFASRFDDAVPYLPGSPPGEQFAKQIIDMFGDLDTQTKSLTLLESLPLEEITIGGTTWNGWRLTDGAVIALRSSGHTAGHVVVFLPGPKLLHLADETTGYYQAFSGGSPATNLLTLERSARAVEDGAVDIVTDGHTFAVHRGEAAVEYLDALVAGALAYDAAVIRILNEHPNGIAVPDLVAEVSKAPEMANAPGGANPIPIFGTMQLLNKLDELGIAAPAEPDGLVSFPR